jgi:diguanylate cyclase (GGDEF)-like protein
VERGATVRIALSRAAFALALLSGAALGVCLGVAGLRFPAWIASLLGPVAALILAFAVGAAVGRRGVHVPGDGLLGRVIDRLAHLVHWAGFEAKLTDQLARANRAKIPSVLILLRVDQLGRVDEAHGRGVGDRLLYEVGCAVRRVCRARDVVARWGGGAAHAVLAPWTNAHQGTLLAERIVAAVRRDCGSPVIGAITVSAGVTDSERAQSFAPDSMFRSAIDALTAAQDKGGDQVATAGGAARASERLRALLDPAAALPPSPALMGALVLVPRPAAPAPAPPPPVIPAAVRAAWVRLCLDAAAAPPSPVRSRRPPPGWLQRMVVLERPHQARPSRRARATC